MLRMMFAGIALACTAVCVAQAADPLQLACTGDMIEPVVRESSHDRNRDL